MAQASGPSNTAKSNTGLGSVLFRPNASITANAYRGIILVEIVLLFGVWCLVPQEIPGPLAVFGAIKDMILTQGLLGEFYTSLVLNGQAIIISTILSLGLSYAATMNAVRPLANMVAKGRFVSLVGLGFVLTLYVGGGHALKLWELVIGMTVFFTVSMVDVVLKVREDYKDYVRTLRANEWEVMYQTQIRGTLADAFDILRQNAAMGWLMLAMVEGTVRSEGGIGTMLVDSNKHFNLAMIFAIQSVFVTVGIGQDALIVWLKNITCPYAALRKKENR